MGLPQPTEARRYYRAAKQRYEDAVLLLDADEFMQSVVTVAIGRKGECRMPIRLRKKRPDAHVKQIAEALRTYENAHPDAEIEVYRQNPVSVRIRVIDSSFAGTSRAEREDALWQVLENLPDDIVAEISVLLLLTPEEARESFASLEFDHPVPSKL